MKKPTTFIFDYGNVISIVDPGIFWRTVKSSWVGEMTGEERIDRARELLVAYETGAMETEDFIRSFMARTGLHMTREAFIKAWSGFFIPMPYTRRLIRVLKRTSRLGLLSNTNPLHFDGVIKPTDIYPLFDAVSFSYEVGVMKPDRRPFDDVIRKLNTSPEECVYFDDLLDNVNTARDMGMHPIHVESEQQLASEVSAAFPWIGPV